MNYSFFLKLHDMTGWDLVNVPNRKCHNVVPGYTAQIVFGRNFDDADDNDAYACIWYDGWCYRKILKVDGKYIKDDVKIDDLDIDKNAAWCKKCEKLIRKKMIRKAGKEYEA